MTNGSKFSKFQQKSDEYITRQEARKRTKLIRNMRLDKEFDQAISLKAQSLFGFDLNVRPDFSSLNEFVDLAISKLQIFSDSIDWKQIIVSFLLCISSIWCNWDRPATILMAVSQFIMNLRLSNDIMTKAMSFFMDLFDKARSAITNVMESLKNMYYSSVSKISHIQKLKGQFSAADFSVDIAPVLPIIGGAATALFTLAVLRELPGGDKFQTTFDRFSKMSGVIRSFSDLEKIGNNFFSNLWDSISFYVFGVEKPVMDEWKNINLWIDEVTTLIVPDFETQIKANERMKNQVETLIQRGMNILRILDMLKVPMTERQSITSCMMFLYRARETASNCGAGQTKPRVAPAIIHFYGDSGVGKSTSLWSLIAEIQAALGVTSASDLHEKTYFRRPGGKFWDGYSNGMNIVVCDDFGAIKDSQAAPNEEFLEAIHMSNTAFWQLNMADLKDKGNTFFQAKCVLWTSNRSRFDVVSLTNPEAVLRRVDLKIRQKPHPNFTKTDIQNGRQVSILDSNKVNAAIGIHGSAAMLNCILFDVIDKNCPNDTVITPDITFWDVAKLCVDTVLQNVNHFEDFNKVLEDHVQTAINRCNGGEWIPGTSDFDPNTFIMPSRVKSQGLLDYVPSLDSVYNVVDNVRKNTGCANVHTGNYNMSKCTDYKVGASSINESDEDRLALLNGKSEFGQCFIVSSDEIDDFMSCYHSATQAMATYFEYDVTDKMFRNLFHQAEKHCNRRFQIDFIEKCNVCKVKSKFQSISDLISGTRSRLETSVSNRFGISPSTFYMVTLAATTIFGFGSYYLYQSIFNRITTMSFESYSNDKGKGRLRGVIGEQSYDQTVAGRKKNATLESYAEKPKANQVKLIRESYADKPKSIKLKTIAEQYELKPKANSVKVVSEGRYCSSCGHENPCETKQCPWNINDGEKRKEFVDTRNILEKSCDFLAKAIPQGPYSKPRCIHGNVQTLCYYCQPCEFESMKAQAIVDQNAAEVVTNMVKNMYKLEYFDGSLWKHAVNLLIVKGRLAILNRHVLVYSGFSQWRIRNNNFQGIEFNLQKCSHYFAPDDSSTPYGYRDVMMIELPDVVHQHKDITSKFMTGDDFARFSQLHQVSLIGYVPQSEVVMRQYFGSDVEADDSVFDIEHPHTDDVLVRVRSLIKYNIQTTGGDCGAVLVAFDKNFSNKIFGIHCAGLKDNRFQGFGTPVSRSMLEYMYERIGLQYSGSTMHPHVECFSEVPHFDVSTDDKQAIWASKKMFDGNFYPIGKDSKPLFQGTETKITPSPVYGMIQTPTMAPAVLKPIVVNGQCVDPMANARIKASPISKPIDLDILKECAYNFYQKVNVQTYDKKILSYAESITGIEGDECYPPMKRSTSPGYGWVKAGVGKTKWLGSGDYILDNPELKSRCDEILSQCKNGERPNTIWSDTLKDERRTLDKVAVAKTRLFSCGEMAYTLVFRTYFAGFIAHMTRNKIDVESCVGTNVYSMDWTKIAKKLKQVGNNILAGDFTNYDGTLHPSILWETLNLINKWYDDGEENALIRTALWSEIVNSIHIVGDNFYMWNHSQPSGCPMTTILNCTYHSISARYVYILCARQYCPELSGLDNFVKHVRHVNYGDDDVWSISSTIIDWFNQVTITEAYKYLGMTYTDEAKTGVIVPFRSLDEINFLKREFRWDSSQARFRAPLSLATIKEMAMWNHGTVDQYPLTASIIQDAVRELAQHDEKTFNAHIGDFERAADVIRRKSDVHLKTYAQYQFEEFLNLGDEGIIH